MMDHDGNKAARAEIAMIKVAAPNMVCRVIGWAIQAFGAAGVTGDYGLAYAAARVLSLADAGARRPHSRLGRGVSAGPRGGFCSRLVWIA
jgi:acyl-CoA dehydrogenase